MRGPGPTDHVFLYRNQTLSKGLIHGRLKLCGAIVNVHISAHRLRHICATQLLNAGCRITSIQKFLGHKRLNTTLTYARVHDQTVANGYYAAMQEVEQRMQMLNDPPPPDFPASGDDRQALLSIVEQLAAPKLDTGDRLELVLRMRQVLCFEALLERASSG